MAARKKVIWSARAEIDLHQILDFFTFRNDSPTYSRKLYKLFVKKLVLVSRQPGLGIRTRLDNIKGLVVKDYVLFYEITEDSIVVLRIWDSRQNPDQLKLNA